MQDDEADRLDTAWDLTARVAPRLPGGHHRRRRLRAADVHPQLRAGRRRHPARKVGPEGAQGAGGDAVKWTDAEDIGIALAEKFPDVDPLTVRFTDLREQVLGARRLRRRSRRRRTSRSSKPSRWRGAKSSRTPGDKRTSGVSPRIYRAAPLTHRAGVRGGAPLLSRPGNRWSKACWRLNATPVDTLH